MCETLVRVKGGFVFLFFGMHVGGERGDFLVFRCGAALRAV